MKHYILLFLLINVTLAIAFANPPKSENIFKRLTKDVPSDKAILIFNINTFNGKNQVTGGEILFSRNATVFSCPMWLINLNKATNNQLITSQCTYYYAVDPGELDINLVNIETTNGTYNTSVGYPVSGTFKLEAGTINYMGEIRIDLEKSTCIIAHNEVNFEMACSAFKKDFPVIFNSANGKINTVELALSHPCETGGTIFSDDFSVLNSNWQFVNNNLHSTKIIDGKIALDNQSIDSSVVYKTIELPKTFEISADVYWNEGEKNKGFGLIIGTDATSCLKFTITANGYYCISRWLGKNGLKWISPIVSPWAKTEFINTNPGEKNVIRIQKTDWNMHTVGIIAFYINDKLLARDIFYISPPAGGSGTQFNKEGTIGLYSYGKQQVSFDNFQMSVLK